MAQKEKTTILEGEVLEALPNTMYKVGLLEGDKTALCTLKGKLRRSYVRIFPGDRVKVEFTPYDETRGRIVAKLNMKRPAVNGRR